MNIYRSILILLLFFFIFEDYIKNNKKMYKFLKIFTIILLVILIGFRGNIARDDQMYIDLLKQFQYSFDFIKDSRFEILYLFLNGMIKVFTDNYSVLFSIVAGISLYNLYKFIDFFSVSFFYSLSFYYCRWIFLKEFTQIRSALACSFLYLALIELYKKNENKYYFWILIGGMFHKAIFFCFTFPIFLKLINRSLKIKEKVIYIFILIFPIIDFKSYFNIFLSKIGIYQVYLTGRYSDKSTDIVYFYSIIFLVILTLFDKKLKLLFQRKYIFLKKVYIFSCLTGAILYHYGDIAGRLTSFFNVEFLLQDKLLSLFKNRLILKVILALFLIGLYYVNFTLKLEIEYWDYFNKLLN
ncbi:EpsG family protein [Fusobacterium mortiferum]|uniref:EpsG family protein n=1 Tax=Fusobacterium mortiferum ATCC 9817 TaxID=469616 RepID=A0ABM6TSU6_FUSMR|nr:EpsG family protein [Fusobacterium mortiferum]AVQ17671.1 EpsG family protein [Fusobacterium mortiferum ATCC 9817]EEO35463.1 hypothetical protein FMAG_01025 [Fusobacterium mortiferum ATCC 9817]